MRHVLKFANMGGDNRDIPLWDIWNIDNNHRIFIYRVSLDEDLLCYYGSLGTLGGWCDYEQLIK